jgi:hypothetical protein
MRGGVGPIRRDREVPCECVRVVMCPIDSENASVDLAHFDPKAVALQVGWRCIHFHFLDFYTHNPHHLILNSVTDPISRA